MFLTKEEMMVLACALTMVFAPYADTGEKCPEPTPEQAMDALCTIKKMCVRLLQEGN